MEFQFKFQKDISQKWTSWSWNTFEDNKGLKENQENVKEWLKKERELFLPGIKNHHKAIVINTVVVESGIDK